MVSTGRAANRLATSDFWSRRAASRRPRRAPASRLASLASRQRPAIRAIPPLAEAPDIDRTMRRRSVSLIQETQKAPPDTPVGLFAHSKAWQ